jgi:glycosyltransferase involved in cell wall biosynthesis
MAESVPVSVVIPVRNGAALIGHALQSIVRQSWRPREIIVVDGDSKDDSESVVRSFENTLFLREPSAGAGEGRNIGARLASMPFLAFLDADDLWPEERTELLLRRLYDRNGLDIVTGKMQQFRTGPAESIVPLAGPQASRLPSVALLRRETFWRIGPFSSEWRVGETVEWWSRAMDAGVTHECVEETVLLRRVHDANLGKTTEAPMRDYLKMLHTVVNRRRDSGLV